MSVLPDPENEPVALDGATAVEEPADVDGPDG